MSFQLDVVDPENKNVIIYAIIIAVIFFVFILPRLYDFKISIISSTLLLLIKWLQILLIYNISSNDLFGNNFVKLLIFFLLMFFNDVLFKSELNFISLNFTSFVLL